VKTVLEPRFKDELYHYGTPRHSGRYPYGSGKRPYQNAKEQHENTVKMIDDLNTNYGYGTIINGVRYEEGDPDHPVSAVDWTQYRTMPVEDFKKNKIGVCWDFVNYQHDTLDKMGIPNKNYMLIMPKSNDPDDILTHTFTIAEIGDKKYYIESAAWPRRGVHEVNSFMDVVEQFRDTASFSKDFDVYEKFEQPLVNDGWDVIVFIPSREEDEDRITCGNSLIALEKEYYF
jgi:hypothetical protein